MRRLVLLRHAKSDRGELLQSDFDRPLADRGRDASRQVGVYLRESNFVPDLILCSPSRRTMETLESLPRASFPNAEVHEISALYHAEASTLLETIQNSNDKFMTLLVIGHNPGIQQLAIDLSGRSNDLPARRLAEKFPTAALAVYDIDAESWHLAAPRCAHLVAFVTPRDLPD